METTDIDYFNQVQYLKQNSNDCNNIRIGFSQRSLLHTQFAHIAIYQDKESLSYKFCCYNGKSDFCFNKDTYFPIVIIISPNTDIANGIIPLRIIPVYENEHNITNKGIEIVFSYKENLTVSLYKDGVKQSITENESNLLVWYYLYNTYKKTSEETYWNHISLTKQNIEKQRLLIEKSLETFSIEDVLNGLKINVREVFINKIGGDDRYYIYKTVQTNYPIEQLDSYIQNYIGIGDREIYKDSGYTSAYNLSLKNFIIGEYNEEQLNKEKEKLIFNYSKEKHIQALLMDYIVDKAKPTFYNINNIEKKIKMLERTSNFWISWRIIRSKKFSSYFDDFDKRYSRIGIKEGNLKDSNKLLFETTKYTYNLEKLDLFTGIPNLDIF